jgi:predicted RNase H-like HicB family nuclease
LSSRSGRCCSGTASEVWAMSDDYRYEIIMYWSEEDQAVIAEVPELSGCAADGTTYQEALANVQVIITEWIETAKELGRPIPQPKGRLLYA